ncbi:DUF2062 domain-containing protein [Synoicihabitans lomoniglobus]|uniref:DUF2062 domain-containing protein n=1 Tax=Synoicihabitans lomoniglobus TaxID=2909285 RepID=A0AAE9ZZP3_9BACT|nr:DUF2062 domain-containing protein [Opitutaceae bacterium LMO-M01]WED63607.1 DUF2062 domain-containing protein [Opitutaceae bacterium LMO-M01]
MDQSEHPENRQRRFARIRRAKWMLRYLPRRARFHRYPLIGRFADAARKMPYLWSFRKEDVRPALYAGAIVAVLPIMGVQVPVAFGLALLLRCNVMLLIGLQFITNPFTAAFIYFGTYQLGHWIIGASGFGASGEFVPVDGGTPLEHTGAAGMEPVDLAWTQTLGTTVNSLVLGGIIAGALLGLILDILWRNGVAQAVAHKAKVEERKRRSGSTPPVPPTK